MPNDFYEKLAQFVKQEEIKAITPKEEGYWEFCMEWSV